MLIAILFILFVSFVLYTLLGGADFGAGIVETFAGSKGEKTISKAMAPVWEANHVWLILAVVILFTAFPTVYSTLSLVLHIPLMIVLIGIIFRGSAFTFRHYETPNDRFHPFYSLLFKLSSFITPVFLGITLGSMMLGKITLVPSAGFHEKFIAPWFNIFCIALGIFSTSLFSYIAAIFLVNESNNVTERKKYTLFAKRAMIITLLTGILVFLSGEKEGLQLAAAMLESTGSIVMILLATAACPLIWWQLNKKEPVALYLRMIVGLQVTAIIIGWFFIQYPVIIAVKSGEPLTIFNAHAPEITLKYLLIALITGLVLIIPGFIFLFKVFKAQT